MRIPSKTVDVDQFPVVTPPIHSIVGGSIGNDEYFTHLSPTPRCLPEKHYDLEGQ